MTTGTRSITTRSLTFQVPFIDHGNEENRANVLTEAEKLASGGFLVGVLRDRDGKIAKAIIMLVNVALKETTEYAEYFLRCDELTICLD